MFSRVGPFTNMPGDVLPEYLPTHRVMKDTIQFGFHPVGGRNAHFSRDLLIAGCCNHGGHAVCYGAWPFRGLSEMEVKIIGIPHNDSISAYEQELLMGLMKRKKGTGHVDCHNDVPRCSQDKPADHFIVYQSFKVSNKMDPKNIVVKEYGYRTTLRLLDKWDTLGMQVTENGELYFYVKGVCQGLAATNVYLEGYDIYPFFELRGNVHVVRVTKACRAAVICVFIHGHLMVLSPYHRKFTLVSCSDRTLYTREGLVHQVQILGSFLKMRNIQSDR